MLPTCHEHMKFFLSLLLLMLATCHEHMKVVFFVPFMVDACWFSFIVNVLSKQPMLGKLEPYNEHMEVVWFLLLRLVEQVINSLLVCFHCNLIFVLISKIGNILVDVKETVCL